jgi:hypothetical protein
MSKARPFLAWLGATLAMTAGQAILVMLYLQAAFSGAGGWGFIGGLLIGVFGAMLAPILAVKEMAGAGLFTAPAFYLARRKGAGCAGYSLAGAVAGTVYGLAWGLHAHALAITPQAHYFDWMFGIPGSNPKTSIWSLLLPFWIAAGAGGGCVFWWLMARGPKADARSAEPAARPVADAAADRATRWTGVMRWLLWPLTLIAAPVLALWLVAFSVPFVSAGLAMKDGGGIAFFALFTVMAIPLAGLWLGWQGLRRRRPGRMLAGILILSASVAFVAMPMVTTPTRAPQKQDTK